MDRYRRARKQSRALKDLKLNGIGRPSKLKWETQIIDISGWGATTKLTETPTESEAPITETSHILPSSSNPQTSPLTTPPPSKLTTSKIVIFLPLTTTSCCAGKGNDTQTAVVFVLKSPVTWLMLGIVLIVILIALRKFIPLQKYFHIADTSNSKDPINNHLTNNKRLKESNIKITTPPIYDEPYYIKTPELEPKYVPEYVPRPSDTPPLSHESISEQEDDIGGSLDQSPSPKQADGSDTRYHTPYEEFADPKKNLKQ